MTSWIFGPGGRIAVVGCLLLLLAGPSGPAGERAPGASSATSRFFLGGIQVNEPDHDRWVASLRSVGMNTVGVTVYARQGDWDSDHLWWNDDEPAVVDEIRQAKAAGLSVVMILRLAVDHAFPRNEFVWHGMVMPSSAEAIDSWFAQYTRFARKWARTCQREGCDVLGIGSELNALTATRPVSAWGNQRNYWGALFYERRYRARARRFAGEIEAHDLWARGQGHHASLEQYLDARYRSKTAWARQVYLREGRGTLRSINDRRRRILGHWRALIDEVRAVYDGPLTYAANFDAYQNVAFWDRLDLMGINSYFPLRTHIGRPLTAGEKLELFERCWRGILSDIDDFQHSVRVPGMPVMLTEIGYTFRRNSTVEPWNDDGFSVVGWRGRKPRLIIWSEQPVDYEERSLAVRALRRAWRDSPLALSGILYWKLSTDRRHEGIEPFVLHVGPDSRDPLQRELVAFLSGAP